MVSESNLIKSLRIDFLDEKCPHIDVNEDEAQIKVLLLEDSSYRNELIKWLLQNLTDSLNFGDTNETMMSFGLDLKSLCSWRLGVDLIKSKSKHSSSGFDGLRQARHYLDFLMTSNLATPVNAANVKSNLIPRDIDKDVTSRAKRDDDFDILAMKENDLSEIHQALYKEIAHKKSQLGDDVPCKAGKESVEFSNQENLDMIMKHAKQYIQDYEQDFKPWTDRSEAPETNGELECQIKDLHSIVHSISESLALNTDLRQSTVAISDLLKRL